jgi:hypothetical protein
MCEISEKHARKIKTNFIQLKECGLNKNTKNKKTPENIR